MSAYPVPSTHPRFCPISPNPISPKPNSPNPDPNPIPNPIPNPKHTATLKLTVNIRRNGIRRNGRTPSSPMRPDSLLRLWRYINHLLTYLLNTLGSKIDN